MVIAATPNLANSCGGTTAGGTAAANNLGLTNGTLAANSSCTISVNVTAFVAATNSTGIVTSTNGGNGNTASALLTVTTLSAPTVALAFGAATVPVGGTTSLTVTITNSNALPISGLTFTDILPAGLVVATPSGLSNTCGGSIIAAAGSGSLSLSGGTVAANTACVVSINVTATTLGVKSNVISSASSGNAPASGSVSASITVNAAGTSTTLTSSLNPSGFGQAVTFTATVASSGATPTGTVTFLDGGGAIGTGVLAGGVATFVTSALSIGTHAITASFAGNGNFTTSASAALTQMVGTPADSVRLRALQLAVTKIEAQASGAAFQGAVDGAISDGFSDSGGPSLSSTGSGVHLNFGAEPGTLQGSLSGPDTPPSARESVLRESGLWPGQSYSGQQSSNTDFGNSRVNDAFGALAYAPTSAPAKAPPLLARQAREWQFWADIRGTGWNTDVSAGDIAGGQVNALLGVTRRLTPDFLIGMVGGYETFNYSSTTLNGRLKGYGWTMGGYLGWRISSVIRFDAALARSGVSYDGVSGAASATFPGSRWIGSAGLTGTYKVARLEIEPSAKIYALWEHDKQYVDSLGTVQSAYDFSSGRASGGAKVAYPWVFGAATGVTPYVGAYADYYFNNSGTSPLLPTQFVQGWSARLTSGLNFNIVNGVRGSIGAELGGLGNDFITWSVGGRANVPFSF
ncbi:Ig-like domain repeat protein [Bradyrhizobium sp. NAS80.1]|uniref:DUF7933 domain-containing protein n=1 Tax=Bradyrhizobium sp. NAS80.1 TaxID=1680159 RepID=UPI00143D4604|nr:Ig-like domain repeat protein [Bradyrhizobium sp. NAS80.1]